MDHAYSSFGKDDQKAIEKITASEAEKLMEAGEFGKTDMLPKIRAAVEYLKEVPEGTVVITSLAHAKDAAKGRFGTVITA